MLDVSHGTSLDLLALESGSMSLLALTTILQMTKLAPLLTSQKDPSSSTSVPPSLLHPSLLQPNLHTRPHASLPSTN